MASSGEASDCRAKSDRVKKSKNDCSSGSQTPSGAKSRVSDLCGPKIRRPENKDMQSTRSSRSSSSNKSECPPLVSKEQCFDQKVPFEVLPCKKSEPWQNGTYCKDDCGSGIVPKKFNFKYSRKLWCKTPLTMYQATIGELGRQILCREKVVPRNVLPEPPCNIGEYILPPCKGYYRRYDCLRPCEEEYVTVKKGKKMYRDRVERYWEPCISKDERAHSDPRAFAGHNSYLGQKMRRKFEGLVPCW